MINMIFFTNIYLSLRNFIHFNKKSGIQSTINTQLRM